MCPEIPYVEGFDGIKSATAVGTGSVTIDWDAPTSSKDIVGYGIYQGENLDTLRTSVKSTKLSTTIADLPVDTNITIGVRAVDKYGRVDSNTKSIAVKTTNNKALEFSGLASATRVSSSSIKLKWLAPNGLPWNGRSAVINMVSFNSCPSLIHMTGP